MEDSQTNHPESQSLKAAITFSLAWRLAEWEIQADFCQVLFLLHGALAAVIDSAACTLWVCWAERSPRLHWHVWRSGLLPLASLPHSPFLPIWFCWASSQHGRPWSASLPGSGLPRRSLPAVKAEATDRKAQPQTFTQHHFCSKLFRQVTGGSPDSGGGKENRLYLSMERAA